MENVVKVLKFNQSKRNSNQYQQFVMFLKLVFKERINDTFKYQIQDEVRLDDVGKSWVYFSKKITKVLTLMNTIYFADNTW